MNRAAFVVASSLVAFALTGSASAQQPGRRPPEPQPGREPPPSTVTVAPPPGWNLDAGRTAGQAKSLRRQSHLGGEARAAAAFYVSSPPGAVLIVSELVAEPAPSDVVGAARAELAAVRGVVEAVGGTLGAWRFQGGDPSLPEARLEWTDASLGTTSITRALVFRTADLLTVVTGECVVAGDAAAMRAPCEAALAALAPVAALQRLEVGMGTDDPAKVAATPTAAAEGEPAPAPGTGSSGPPAPTMREGGPALPATIMVKPPAAQRDMRPVWLLAGLAVLAGVFLWNRRQRQQLEAAEERERRRGEGRRERQRDQADDKADADDAKADTKGNVDEGKADDREDA